MNNLFKFYYYIKEKIYFSNLWMFLFRTERIIKILKFVIWYNSGLDDEEFELNFYDKNYYYECDKLFWIIYIIHIKVRKDD